jgi:hypothetical protein
VEALELPDLGRELLLVVRSVLQAVAAREDAVRLRRTLADERGQLQRRDPAIEALVFMLEMDVRLSAIFPEARDLRFLLRVVLVAEAGDLVPQLEGMGRLSTTVARLGCRKWSLGIRVYGQTVSFISFICRKRLAGWQRSILNPCARVTVLDGQCGTAPQIDPDCQDDTVIDERTSPADMVFLVGHDKLSWSRNHRASNHLIPQTPLVSA